MHPLSHSLINSLTHLLTHLLLLTLLLTSLLNSLIDTQIDASDLIRLDSHVISDVASLCVCVLYSRFVRLEAGKLSYFVSSRIQNGITIGVDLKGEVPFLLLLFKVEFV